MTLAELLTKFKAIPAPTRAALPAHFVDEIDVPNGPQTAAFLFLADAFCATPGEKAAFSELLAFAQADGALGGFPNLITGTTPPTSTPVVERARPSA